MPTTLDQLDLENRLLGKAQQKTAIPFDPTSVVGSKPVSTLTPPTDELTQPPDASAVTSDGGIELTPDQQKIAEQLSQPVAAADGGIELTPEQQKLARGLSGELDPLQDFTPEQLAHLEISDPENFNLRREYMSRPDLIGNPEIIKRASDANNLIHARNEPPSFSTVGLPPDVASGARVVGAGKQLFETAKNIHPLKAAYDFAKGVAKYSLNSVLGVAAGSPKIPESTRQEYRQKAAENLAASEMALTGLAGGAKTAGHKIAQVAGLAKPYSEYTAQEKQDSFFSDLAKESERERIAKGHGPVTTQVGGEIIKELEAAGKPVRPEEVGQLASGDPFTFYAFAKGLGAAGGLVSPEAKAAANTAGNWIAEVGRDTTGTALEGVGAAARAISESATVPAKLLGKIRGGVTGAVAQGVKKVAEVLPDISESVQSIGKQVAKRAEIAPTLTGDIAQIITDVAESTPAALGEVAAGIGFDVGTAAAMAEFPEEERGTGIGTAFGFLGAGKHVGGRVISGQEIAPRAWGSKNPISTSGPFKGSEFDTLHNAAYQAAPPVIKQRINAVREFMRKATPGVDLFYVPDPAAFETALINQGIDPASAKLWSDQQGLFTKNLNDRKVVFATNIDAAPHESFHPFQDVLGKEANDLLNQAVRKSYTPEEFEQQARQYAGRLGWDGSGDWRDFINQTSGDGYQRAVEKLSQESSNAWKLKTGNEPTTDEAKSEATRIFNEALAEATNANPGVDPATIRQNVWRGLLTAEEQKATAENYISNELSAETWDALFKHTGPGLKDPKGLIPRFAKIAGNFVSALGGEPLAGRIVQGSTVPLKSAAVKAVQETVRGRIETPPLIAGEAVLPKTAPSRPVPLPSGAPSPITPEDRAAVANETRKIAETASDVPVAGGIRSEKELLGEIAAAQAGGDAVKLNYLSAPDEPAAAISSNRTVRRQIIEMFRTMPQAVRSLWEKNFFPERVRKTQKGKIQVGGWAPEVFAANAHKTAEVLAKLGSNIASPYPIDPATKSFTEDGWKQLYEDAQKFVQNQMAGQTGSGETLVVPRELTEKGYFQPPIKTGAGALEQRKADFISAMFGMKLPETPRMSEGKIPLNVAGQIVSEATIPGRVEPAVRPRGTYAKEPVIGRDIAEVNPWRAEFERSAKAADVPLPSTIEAFQWLNLENIKEVQHTPEQPRFRGNTLTLQAGFKPSDNPKAIKEAAVRDDNGKVYTGRIHAEALMKAFEDLPVEEDVDIFSSRGWEDGFVTNDGEFLNREKAHNRAVELKQVSARSETAQTRTTLESDLFRSERRFKPAAERKEIELTGPDGKKYRALFDGYQDATMLGLGHVPQITPLEDLPGSVKANSTTYEPSLTKAGYTLPTGLPEAAPGAFKPNKDVQEIAEKYAGKALPAHPITKINESLAKRIADYYATAKNEPENSEVKASYGALAKEIHDQYNAIVDAGYTLEPWTGKGEPYKSSQEMTDDVADNKHLYFLQTGEAYGGGTETEKNNLMLRPSGAKNWPVNDLFRAVHDFFGHAKEGNGFGPQGELTAWKEHSEMFSDAAQGALAAETLGQNSWVNYGEHLRNAEGNVPKKGEEGYKPLPERPFAEQKNFVLPKKFIDEAKGTPKETITKFSSQTFDAEISKIKTGDSFGQTFTKDGEVWKQTEPVDVVTVASVNIPKESLTPEEIRSSLQRYDEVLDKPGVVAGVFELNPKTVSADVNAVVSQKHRENTKAFATANDQHSFFDADKNTIVETGGKGNTVLKTVPEILDAVDKLIKGEPVQFNREAQFKPQVKLKESDRGEYAENAGFGNFWLSPDGKFYRVGNHQEWAKERVIVPPNDPNPPKKNWEFENRLQDAGWLRISRERETSHPAVFLNGWGNLTPKQITALEEWTAQNPNVEVVDTNGLFSRRRGGITGETQFKPKKGKTDDLKFAAPSAINPFEGSKAWILPNGKVEQLGAQWHHAWLDEHPEIQKKYGLKIPPFEGGDAEGVREQALKKGFARVNLAGNRLVVEAREKDWKNIRPIVENLIERNIDDVDRFQVSLLNDKIDRVTKSYSDKLFDADTDKEKMGRVYDSFSEDPKTGEAAFKPQGTFASFEEMEPQERAEFLTTKKVRRMRNDHPEALPLEYQKDSEGNLKLSRGGKPKPIVSEYDLNNSLLAREAAKGLRGDDREAAYTDALANKLTKFYNEVKKNPDVVAGAKWYSTIRVRLKKMFGDDARFFAHLLAATSARTPVDTNFRFALDAYNRFKSGEYDDLIAKYRAGRDRFQAGDIADYVKATGNADPNQRQYLQWLISDQDLSPRQSNGKKFGSNSRAVLRVLDGTWLEEVGGPKTPNFAGNMTGESSESTIDVWAARTLHRLSNEGYKDRWRILAENETDVTDEDFFTGQKAFRKAADKLGIKPDALQAILWFGEKDNYEKQGWTRGAGAEKSDFNSLLAQTERAPSGALRMKTAQSELELSDLIIKPRNIVNR